MKSLTLKSPAKINLSLRILRRRPDGYHDLVTLFHRISLSDTLTLMKQKEGFSLRCSDKTLPAGEGNLITKAYRLLQTKMPGLGGVSVVLKKKIPVGAGLGGGSSNAGHFLLGMKKLYGLKISQKELLVLGSRLGADVPFFIHNMSQGIGIGKGDRIKKVPLKAKYTFILAASKKGLSTRDVYENLRGKIKALPAGRQAVSLTKVSREITMLCAFLAQKKMAKIDPLLQNDLELSAFELRPSLRSVIAAFNKRGIQLSRMTGSGPTVFGMLIHPGGAKRAVQELRRDLPENEILLCQSY